MGKTRAFIRYIKGKLVPGSLIFTGGEYPKAPFSAGKWQELPYDICCQPFNNCSQNYGSWRLVTGGEAGDGAVLVDDLGDNLEDCPTYTFVGPNDDDDNGWVYLTKYFPSTTCLEIQYEWTTFDEPNPIIPPIHDKPVYWTSVTQPTGEPDDITSKVGQSPDDGTWNITVSAGQWFSIGIYSNDSCCGRGFLTAEICEVECPTTTTTTTSSSTTTTTTLEPTTTSTTTEEPTTTTSTSTTSTTTLAPLNFTFNPNCQLDGSAAPSVFSPTGGTGTGYEFALSILTSEAAALANTSWSSSGTVGYIPITPGIGTYWSALRDSSGTVFAKSITLNCPQP